MGDKSEPWHVDKRVPVALIITILGQTFGAVWWASKVSGDVAHLQTGVARNEARIEINRSSGTNRAVQLGRIEEISLSTQRMVERLAHQIDIEK